jgi:hypothetical protein
LSQARQQPADAGPSAYASPNLGEADGQGGELSEAEQQNRDKQLGFARALSCPGPLNELDTTFLQDSNRPQGAFLHSPHPLLFCFDADPYQLLVQSAMVFRNSARGPFTGNL